MDSYRSIYYIGFPTVTAFLCGFSYYIGYSRGKQSSSIPVPIMMSSPVIPNVEQSDSDKTSAQFTFYKTLKEQGTSLPVPKEENSQGAKKEVALVEDETSKAHDADTVVQVSAFKDIGKAHEMIDNLKNLGYEAFTQLKSPKFNDGWHRVFVGPYDTHEKASEVANELADKGFTQGFVTQLQSKP